MAVNINKKRRRCNEKAFTKAGILLLVVSIIMTMVIFTGNNLPKEVSASATAYGDLNSDGVIDTLDLAMLSRYIMEITDTLPVQEKVADLNGDGVFRLSGCIADEQIHT